VSGAGPKAGPGPREPAAGSLYFRQLLAGRDFARSDALARQMVNFVYLVGDRDSGEAVAVDPAYAPSELLEILEADSMRLRGVLATHYHADHVGGDLLGYEIDGLAELLELADVPVHVQQYEASLIEATTGVGRDHLVVHASDDVVPVGKVPVRLIHTPGHTPGSQCFLVDGRLIAGDTLFLEGCGRTDLPGSDPEAMYDSLQNRLSKLPDSTLLFPGHFYSRDPSASLGDTRRHNAVLVPRSAEEWLARFGG
jgi:glyoxylase-like metal-dependent hydrolase (beta-lactamase superfamily II)